jgi:hypothetical protein
MVRDIMMGDLVVPIAVDRVPTAQNPDGNGIPMWNDDLTKLLGFVRPGSPLMVLATPRGRYARVLTIYGPAWVQISEVKHL